MLIVVTAAIVDVSVCVGAGVFVAVIAACCVMSIACCCVLLLLVVVDAIVA